MSMSPEFKIHLTIAGKSYPLSIRREEEEKYRRAEREINNLVAKFRGTYRMEDQDYLAMAALQIAMHNVEMEMSRSLGDDIDALVEIDAELERYLGSME